MPQPRYRSRSYRRLARVTPKKRNVTHYVRKSSALPHCAICGKELNGISSSRKAKGKTLKSNARIFGGVLCSSCTAEVIKLASRIENGEMKLNDINIKQREYVLQMISH
ncbi:MAG: 50S ribosomal protein L34e [Candidatus Micrarchaeia archaeon]